MQNDADRRKLWRPSGLAWVAFLSHGIWLVLFVYILTARWGLSAGPPCEICQKAADAINTAADMGRLDYIAMSLTFLGVVLALGAVLGFFTIRHSAMHAATEEAKAQIDRLIQPTLVQHLEQNGARLLRAALKDEPGLFVQLSGGSRDARRYMGDVSSETANEIAADIEGDENARSN